MRRIRSRLLSGLSAIYLRHIVAKITSLGVRTVFEGNNENRLLKVSNRINTDYDTYVLRYARAQGRNVFCIAAGVALCMLALLMVGGNWQIILIVVGIGAACGGAAGFIAAGAAHGEYRQLAVNVTETWLAPQGKPVADIARPFVASKNGDNGIRTGRLQFSAGVWRALYELTAKNGTMSRDTVAKRAGIGRRWYHTDPNSPYGYGEFKAEMTRLGFLDSGGRVTDAFAEFYAQLPGNSPTNPPTPAAFDRSTRV